MNMYKIGGHKAVASLLTKAGLKRLKRDESGTTAVEFAFVAIPFITLLVAIFEIGLMLLATYSLDNAVAQTARLVRTGQAQAGSFDPDQFKTQICERSILLPQCMSVLKIDVQAADAPEDLNDVETTDPDTGGVAAGDDLDFTMGNGRQLTQVTAFFEWEYITGFPNLFGATSSKKVIRSSIVQRNEPFN